ncbi:MAG: CDP-alcohol phosphatidyltransferase family protein [Anaerolineae bacterium]|nr:CDP-alcohol phosphatidyltransferase family protein [Anaerolineae bacterium]MBL6964960.1 CDP-alcohol phosphatidyltransferase family protein [Anaerolineales bacterium]
MKSIKNQIPNLLTFTNVACGFVAMIKLVEAQYIHGMLWMFLAVIFDAIDGLVASMLNAQSDVGGTIDMLADVVSFAVLPGIGLYLFFALAPGEDLITSIAAWVAGIGYTSAGLLRETRFITSQLDRERSQGFIGLGIAPPAGFNVAVMSLVNFYPEKLYTPFVLVLVFFVAAFHAYLMTRSQIIFYRWGRRGISIQFATSILAGVLAYDFLKSFGAALAIFFIFVCAIYIYAHVVYDFFRRTANA